MHFIRAHQDRINPDEGKPVNSLVFLDDGAYLASCGGDGYAAAWNVATQECLRRVSGTYEQSRIARISDEQLFISGRVNIWKWKEERSHLAVGARHVHMAWFDISTDGTKLVSTDSGLVRCFDLPTCRKSSGWQGIRNGASYQITGDGKISPSMTWLAVSTQVPQGSQQRQTRGRRHHDSSIFVYQFNNAQLKFRLNSPFSHRNDALLAWSPDESMLAAAYGPMLRIFDTESRTEVFSTKLSRSHIKEMAFTPDGQ